MLASGERPEAVRKGGSQIALPAGLPAVSDRESPFLTVSAGFCSPSHPINTGSIGVFADLYTDSTTASVSDDRFTGLRNRVRRWSFPAGARMHPSVAGAAGSGSRRRQPPPSPRRPSRPRCRPERRSGDAVPAFPQFPARPRDGPASAPRCVPGFPARASCRAASACVPPTPRSRVPDGPHGRSDEPWRHRGAGDRPPCTWERWPTPACGAEIARNVERVLRAQLKAALDRPSPVGVGAERERRNARVPAQGCERPPQRGEMPVHHPAARPDPGSPFISAGCEPPRGVHLLHLRQEIEVP